MFSSRLVVSLVAMSAFAAAATVRHTQASRSPAPPAQADRVATDRVETSSGVREAAWSPDGTRLAVSWYDALWTMAPDGRNPKRLIAKPDGWITERDAAWSPDGKSIAFAADTAGAFSIRVVAATGGASKKLVDLPGDSRWPSWTHDGRIVFSHRRPKGTLPATWQLFVVSADGSGPPARLTKADGAEWQGAVSPDGKTIAFLSDRNLATGAPCGLWVEPLASSSGTESAGAVAMAAPSCLDETSGDKEHPTWAPDHARVAYYAVRPGLGAGVWVASLPSNDTADAAAGGRGRGGRANGQGARGGGAPGGGARATRGGPSPAESALLASRHGGVPAWSPDGNRLAIATFPLANAAYNGNPDRNDDDVPMAVSDASAYALWIVDAPRAVDQDAASVALPSPDAARWTSAFDQIWQTIKSLYYEDSASPSAAAWNALGEKYRPQASRATDRAGFEDVVDAMVAEEPLIKPGAESTHGVATSGNRLASAAGAEILAKGGNVVDAGIAVAIALGVVEPDATSLGGDGQAILFLKGMSAPVVVEYKDMSPSHATSDNPKLFTPTGGRTANDGPSVANIPGVAAGLDLLYQKYGSRKVAWADLVAPSITLADDGFILDEALPTTIAEGRAQFEKYPESARLFLPNGRVPQPGERFVNHDYAETLRILAKEGGRSFYTGTLAQKVAADMEANGGAITAEDLAQYRAMERTPLVGHYRGDLVYSVPAPVSTGAQLIETLQILDNYTPKPLATYTTDADYFHYAIDAWRVRDGGARIADPERWPVDYGNHLDPAHALERFKLLDPRKAWQQQGPRGGQAPLGPRGPQGPQGSQGPGVWIAEDESGAVQTGTTGFVVADAEGNMIAFTQTLSTWGGNYYVSKGLGFLYNDHFRGGGGRGGGFGSLLPLMRSNSTSVPTLVFAPVANGAAGTGIPGFTSLMAVGCAGNAWIPASVYDIVLNVVDGGMSAQRAIEAPRFLIGGGAGVQIEDRFPRSLLADLEARGHTFQKIGRKGEVKYGYASVAVIDAAKGTVAAGAEPRRSHGAVAVK